MAGFSASDWLGASASIPQASPDRTEGLRAHVDGGNVGGTRSQAASNMQSGDQSLLYWQAGLIAASIVILWMLGYLGK